MARPLVLALAALLAAAPALAQTSRPVLRDPADEAPGWTLRAARDGTPVAMLDGPGNIRHLALFCLSGEPFLALAFRAAPAPETLRLGFAFAHAGYDGEARREPGAGGAHVLALRDQPVAGLLAGRDGLVELTINGASAGTLTLRGSSKAIRAALDPCMDF